MCLAVDLSTLDKLIDVIIKQETEEFIETITGQVINPQLVNEFVDNFESEIYKILTEQKKHHIEKLKEFETLTEYAIRGKQSAFSTDDTAEKIRIATIEMLTDYIYEVVPEYYTEQDQNIIIKSNKAVIAKEKFFSTTTYRTIDWMESWSEELGQIMNITSQKQLTDKFNQGLAEGKGIDWIVREIEDLPGFDRQRARTTAITEVLTADSYAKHEAYMTNPVVISYKWKHAGRVREPRKNHLDLNGEVVPKGEYFQVSASEQAQFPRQTTLSAKERVHCHCTYGTIQDENILGLSNAERLGIRESTIEGLNSEFLQTATQTSVDRINRYIAEYITPRVVYQQATTAKQARDKLKDITGAEKVSYAGIPLDVANGINEDIYDFIQEYPELKGYINEIKTVKVKSYIAQMEFQATKTGTKRILNLNRNAYESEDLLDDIYADMVQRGMLPLTTNSTDIMRHELTHALEYYIYELETGLIDSYSYDLMNETIDILKYSKIPNQIIDQAITELGLDETMRYGARASISKNSLLSPSETIADANMLEDGENEFADAIKHILNERLRGE